MAKPLTKKQDRFLCEIERHVSIHGHFPTYEHLRAHFGFKSPHSVTQNLYALERKGYLTRDDYGFHLGSVVEYSLSYLARYVEPGESFEIETGGKVMKLSCAA